MKIAILITYFPMSFSHTTIEMNKLSKSKQNCETIVKKRNDTFNKLCNDHKFLQRVNQS